MNRYRNPADLRRMIRRQERPSRAAWQKPAAVVRALGLRRGQVVADVGAGPGYWTCRLARAVGRGGRVFAVEAELEVMEVLRRRLAAAGIRNVTPVLGDGADPRLPHGSCDLVLVVNTYHHFHDGVAFLRSLARALRPGGRLVNIDFAKRPTPVGPPVDHRVAREDFIRDARRAGLEPVAEPRLLPYQYFVILKPSD